jgi:hypothetical protein
MAAIEEVKTGKRAFQATPHYTTMHCTALHYTALHFTALH